MKVILLLQRDYRTISLIQNDRGEPVARSNDPRFVSMGELEELARKFKKENPDLFPGEVKSV